MYLSFREQLPPIVAAELDSLLAQLRGFLGVSFNEDGTLISAAPDLSNASIGFVNAYAGSTAPNGWLLCDGSQVSRATYAALFVLIGTTYGSGDGSTTFNLPDLRGKFPLGVAASGTGSSLGATGGSIDHTHGNGTLAVSLSGSTGSTAPGTDSQGSHSHGGNTGSSSPGTGSESSSHRHGSIEVDDNNDGLRQQVMNYADETSSHSHTVNSHSHSISSDGSHSHTVSSHTHAVGTLAASLSGAMGTANPPYIALNYIIYTGRDTFNV